MLFRSNSSTLAWKIPWTEDLCPWNSPGQNTGVSCHFLFQGIFPTQGSNPCLMEHLHWQADSLTLSHLGGWYSKYFKIVSEVRPVASLSEFPSSIHLPLLPEDCSFSPRTGSAPGAGRSRAARVGVLVGRGCSIGPCFCHQSHPQLGIVFALAPSLHSFWSYFSTDLQ